LRSCDFPQAGLASNRRLPAIVAVVPAATGTPALTTTTGTPALAATALATTAALAVRATATLAAALSATAAIFTGPGFVHAQIAPIDVLAIQCLDCCVSLS